MEETPRPALNTKEFVANWHNIVQEHLVTSLADSLGRLAAGVGEASLSPDQRTVLAHHVARALMVAASAAGGVEPAVEYLHQASVPPA